MLSDNWTNTTWGHWFQLWWLLCRDIFRLLVSTLRRREIITQYIASLCDLIVIVATGGIVLLRTSLLIDLLLLVLLYLLYEIFTQVWAYQPQKPFHKTVNCVDDFRVLNVGSIVVAQWHAELLDLRLCFSDEVLEILHSDLLFDSMRWGLDNRLTDWAHQRALLSWGTWKGWWLPAWSRHLIYLY